MAIGRKLQGFIDRYGSLAGPRLYHALQSRAAYIGANARRRKTIAGLIGQEAAPKRAAAAKSGPVLFEVEAESGR